MKNLGMNKSRENREGFWLPSVVVKGCYLFAEEVATVNLFFSPMITLNK